MQSKDGVIQFSVTISEADGHVRKQVKIGPLDLKSTLIYPGRLLESNPQGSDLNPIILLFHVLESWI